VIRHALAPINRAAATALALPRRLELPGVALTFDDGPHPEGTPLMLELLARAGAHATFFMIGEQVARRPELAAEVAAAGHRLALHGFHHRLQPRLSAAAVRDDLVRGREAIAAATGDFPRWHRPPFGIYSPAGLTAARELGLRPLLWSRWGKDWRKFTTPARIYTRAGAGASDGDVILLHDADFYSSKGSHQRTAGALELILDHLDARKVATVVPD
jgi:peptidoglycan/xylan/chitin deacetylase (PgdA/CDA1 family)